MAPCYLSSQYFNALLLGICALVSTLSNIIERLQKLTTASNVIKVNDCCGNKLCFISYHKILSVLLHGFYTDCHSLKIKIMVSFKQQQQHLEKRYITVAKK